MSSASASSHVDAERVERVRELEAAAADVGMIRRDQRDGRVGGDRCARLGGRLTVDADLPGEDQRSRPLARSGEPAFDEQRVEPD